MGHTIILFWRFNKKTHDTLLWRFNKSAYDLLSARRFGNVFGLKSVYMEKLKVSVMIFSLKQFVVESSISINLTRNEG